MLLQVLHTVYSRPVDSLPSTPTSGGSEKLSIDMGSEFRLPPTGIPELVRMVCSCLPHEWPKLQDVLVTIIESEAQAFVSRAPQAVSEVSKHSKRSTDSPIPLCPLYIDEVAAPCTSVLLQETCTQLLALVDSAEDRNTSSSADISDSGKAAAGSDGEEGEGVKEGHVKVALRLLTLFASVCSVGHIEAKPHALGQALRRSESPSLFLT